MQQKKILLIGLPSTGKTTFIAALWHYVQFNGKEKSLVLNSLAKGEHEYLNSICTDWLKFKRVTRTPNTNPAGQEIIMDLKHCLTGDKILLDIPDFSGETYKSQFLNREWSNEFDSKLDSLNGLFLFVNAEDSNNRPVLITDAIEAASILGDEILYSNEGVEFTNWSPELCSNQVQLVDILQFILFHKRNVLPVKINVMVSAWDKLESRNTPINITPKEWIKNNLPLLFQFLTCNGNSFEAKFLGISAQGVDYDDEPLVDKLIDIDISKRIIIKEEHSFYNDITKPLVWLSE